MEVGTHSENPGPDVEVKPPESVLEIALGGGGLNTVGRYRQDLPGRPRIDGIEIGPQDVPDSMLNRFDKLYYGHPAEILPTLGVYDMIVIGDRLWEYGADQVWPFIRSSFQHCSQVVAVYCPLPGPGEQVANHSSDSCPICCLKELFPVSFNSSFLSAGEEKRCCLLLISKKDYRERRLNTHLQGALEAIGHSGCRSLQDKYELKKEHVCRIDLRSFARYLADAQYGQYFLDPCFHEHYRLIACLSGKFDNGIIFDIGTNKGYSALALASNPSNRVISYDLLDCRAIHGEDDLDRIEFCLGDVLQDPRLGQARLVMLDTDHDGKFESQLYSHLKKIGFSGLLFLDDIHLNPQMESFWKSIREPKADLTDLGHWTGSGLVDFGGD